MRQSTLHQVACHRESTALQYDLARYAIAWGWPRDRVLVIDEDLGQSAQSAETRPGFQRLLGHAARIFGLASRTKIVEPPSRARSEELMHHRINRDLLATAAQWTGVLIPLLYFGNQFVDAHFYPNEGHGFAKRENQIDALQRTVDWFDKYLKPQG